MRYNKNNDIEIIKLIKSVMKKPLTLYTGLGCKFCDNSGYKGRTGIFEIMHLSEEVRNLIIQKSSSEKIQQASIKTGMNTMQKDGFNKVLEGITTVEEVSRVLDV